MGGGEARAAAEARRHAPGSRRSRQKGEGQEAVALSGKGLWNIATRCVRRPCGKRVQGHVEGQGEDDRRPGSGGRLMGTKAVESHQGFHIFSRLGPV